MNPQLLCPNEIPPHDASAVHQFILQVSEGIEQRGFHVAEAGSLLVLWSDGELSPVEKLQRVHCFATEHGWEVAAKDKVSRVLFQPAGRRCILPAMWRLCGTN